MKDSIFQSLVLRRCLSEQQAYGCAEPAAIPKKGSFRTAKAMVIIMNENICKFANAGTKTGMENLHILNFVYEKKADFRQSFLIPASYAVYLVTSGTGLLHTDGGVYPLDTGDLFFTFSAKPYYIENTAHLQFIYISFIGQRANGLLQRMYISPTTPVYHGFSFLTARFTDDFTHADAENTDLVAEALLLYTLSFLCQSPEEPKSAGQPNHILAVKEYIDLHYTDSDVNLGTVSRAFGYTPKYLSAAFVKLMKISFTAYLRQLRMQHAASLLDSGMSGIKQIAHACGYADALYFSKVFCRHFGVSPRQYQKDAEKALTPFS